MDVMHRDKIVVLGMMTKMPVAGVIWQNVHYVVGLRRLGYEVYYVEAHGRTPTSFMEEEGEDPSEKAAAFIDGVMRKYDMGDRWAFHALHSDGKCYGMSAERLKEIYREAALIINLHGGTEPRPEHYATGRLVFLETDPVELQIELYHNKRTAVEFLSPHVAFFTFGENYGRKGCGLPVSPRFEFKPTRQPVVADLWEHGGNGEAKAFTTVGNWQQPCREVRFRGDVYQWSKHYEFMKFIELPKKTTQEFELALSSYGEADRKMLEGKGWRVRHALDLSTQAEPYREYIAQSRGEFTVAKDQNVRLRSGWFSDRSATYLAAGRPVITQETGFSDVLPTGKGLFGFSTMEEALGAVEAVNSDYAGNCAAAKKIARECFNYDVVLGKLLSEVGI